MKTEQSERPQPASNPPPPVPSGAATDGLETSVWQRLGGWRTVYIWVVALCFLYVAGRTEFLLFHTLVELVTIAIAACVVLIAWNGQRFQPNSYLTVLGLGFGSVAAVTLAHVLAYKGMNLIPDPTYTLSSQLWIASRAILALALLVAPLAMGRRLRPALVLSAYLGITAVVLGAILVWHVFPVTFVEGRGVTPFKMASEYVICGLMVAALVMTWRRRSSFDREVLSYITAAMLFVIVAELTFSSYINLYGTANILGHLFTLVAFSYFYLAIVRTGFSRPLQLLFRDLTEREGALRRSDERYRDLFNGMTEGFALHEMIYDGTGVPVDYRFLEVNPAFERLTGLRREDIVGKTQREVLPGEDPLWVKVYGEVTLTGDPAHLENYSSVLDKHFEVDAYRPAAGQFAVVFRDVTERRRSQDALLEAERARARMAQTLTSEIGHRTKNNLAIVAGLLQMKVDQAAHGDSGVEFVREAVSRIMSFAALQEQMYQNRTNTIELVDALRRIGEVQREALSSGNAEISVTGEPVHCASSVGTNLCVVANELMTNALKHGLRTGQGREIQATVSQDGGRLVVSIWNSGEAIAADFDLGKARGTGLRMVHDLVVQEYGGSFAITPDGGGTLARITMDMEMLRERP
jgi:PAS domain S-box-containing protein